MRDPSLAGAVGLDGRAVDGAVVGVPERRAGTVLDAGLDAVRPDPLVSSPRGAGVSTTDRTAAISTIGDIA